MVKNVARPEGAKSSRNRRASVPHDNGASGAAPRRDTTCFRALPYVKGGLRWSGLPARRLRRPQTRRRNTETPIGEAVAEILPRPIRLERSGVLHHLAALR